jgi:hypothetical protein
MLLQLPQKVKLASKVVKIDSKIIIALPRAKSAKLAELLHFSSFAIFYYPGKPASGEEWLFHYSLVFCAIFASKSFVLKKSSEESRIFFNLNSFLYQEFWKKNVTSHRMNLKKSGTLKTDKK